MKKLILLILLTSCAHHKKNPSNEQINQYCQDLNVLYQKIAVIYSNISNIKTTRTIEGGYYKKKIATSCINGICEIVNDKTPPIMKYEPKHPDSDKNGYVSYPNINIEEEKSDKIYWERVYSAVIKNSPVSKNFFFKDPKAQICFSKYPELKSRLDYSEYLGRKK
ncbi:MAG: hypothetical protein H7336_06785 [Bacteriovorax sp.]|nr:hypothetical protein [Bacteriovorax sp.]